MKIFFFYKLSNKDQVYTGYDTENPIKNECNQLQTYSTDPLENIETVFETNKKGT